MLFEINVLHVLNSAHGGSALSTFQLIDELKKKGINSSLVCFNNATSAQRNSISAMVGGRILFIPLYWSNKRIRVKWWKRPIVEALTVYRTLWGYRYQKRISKLIKINQIQLVHSSTLVNPEGAIAARKNNLPHVWHVRELIGPNTHYQFPRFLSWISYVEQAASILVANSLTTSNNLSLYFKPAKILCIPNGIDATDYQVKIHHEKRPLVVGMLGNVTSRLKNHEYFIKTAILFRGNVDIRFYIYGELPAEDDQYLVNLRNIVNNFNLHKTVFFIGHKANVYQIMSEIDVLFHPTGLESFGRIFIEAMAGGIPIVAVNEGGAKELVREGINGFRVSENDTQAAAQAIRKLAASDVLRNTMGKNGRAIVEAEYSLSVLADKMHALYKSLAG
jgi:glycosyltransferase involved in cell wall biosynthesis